MKSKGVSGDDDNKNETKKRKTTLTKARRKQDSMAGTQNSGELELTQNCQDSALGQAKRNLLLVNDVLMNIDQSGSIVILNISVLLVLWKKGTGYGNHQTRAGTTTDWFRRWKRRYMV